MRKPSIANFLKANKIVVLFLCSLIIAPQLTQAVIPNLDDLVAINKKRPVYERPIQQAAALILWADKNIDFPILRY